MTWPLAVLLLGVLGASVASVGLYLWARWLMQRERADELTRRLDRLEGEVRTRALQPAATSTPMPMGVFGVKR